MRIHFQTVPWDLRLSIGYSLAVGALNVGLGVSGLFAVFLILLTPGYVLVAVIFPDKGEIDWLERVSLSACLSVATIPLLGLGLTFLPPGIRPDIVIESTVLFTVLAGFAAYWKRLRLPAEKRLSGTLDVAWPRWTEYGSFDRALIILLGVSVAIAAGAITLAIVTPRPGEQFTEFYVLGPGGNSSNYPTRLNLSEPGSIIIGITDHESARVDYTVRIDLVGVRVVYNATSGFNETIELNRTTLSSFNVTLTDGQNWAQPYAFRINATGLWRVDFLLYRDGVFSSAYRELHRFVRVG